MSEGDAADVVTDYDSPWKEALDRYFPEFMMIVFPDVHRRIDWSVPPVFMDKELQQVVRDADSGRNHTDKLVSVRTSNGADTWVLLHVEIQGKSTTEFKDRMFRYFYRLRDRYPERDIASFAVLTDSGGAGNFQVYRESCLGCELEMRFPVAYLKNWLVAERWVSLEESSNPFALVIMAQLQAHRLKDGNARKIAKLQLVRLMRQRGYERQVILELFRLIDWMLQLPAALELEFEREVERIEREEIMAYVTSVERIRIARAIDQERQAALAEGLEKGLAEGLAEGLEKGRDKGREEEALALTRRLLTRKFGQLPLWVDEKLRHADKQRLEAWAEALLDANTLEDFFH